MKKILFLSLGVFLGLSLNSCSSSEEQQPESSQEPQFYGINLPAEGNGLMRGYIDPISTENVWEVNDVVGVFASSGPQQSQVEYVVQQVEGRLAKFTPGSYFNRKDYAFVSYYPRQEKYLKYDSDIELTLAGQVQKSNENAELQSAYLFNVSAVPTHPESDDYFKFTYSRFWSMACFYLTMPHAGTWSQVTITAPEGCFFHENMKFNFSKRVTEPEEDLTGITCLEPTDYTNSISMTLGENGSGITTAADEKLTLFMLVCPTQMTDEDFTISVKDKATGDLYSCKVSGEYESGHNLFTRTNCNYWLIGSPVKSHNIDDVTGKGSDFIIKQEDK